MDAGTRSTVGSLWRRRNLIKVLTSAQLRQVHARTVLGCLWWLLDPLMMTAVFTLVVGFIRGSGGLHDPYPAFLLCGLVAWKAFAMPVQQSVASMARYESLIGSFPFPKAVIPVSIVLAAYVLLLSALAALVGIVAFYEHVMGVPSLHLGAGLLWLPVVVATHLLLTLAAALVGACYGALYLDLENISVHLLQAGFFLSPVLYGWTEVVPGYAGLAACSWQGARTLFLANPLGHVLDAYRATVLHGAAPDPAGLGFAAVVGALGVVGGLRLFRRQELRFAKLV